MYHSTSMFMYLALASFAAIISPFILTNSEAEASLNITRTLLLQVNVTGIGIETEKELIADDYTFTMYVKGNRYSEKIIKPITEVLHENNIIKIPIVNNEHQKDDGSDFRIDVWVNNYDKKFKKVNYPIKYNATFKSVDITDMLEYALMDTRAEKAEDADNYNNDDADSAEEYSLIKDRPDNNGDNRPHAKIKDPKDNS